MNQQWIDYLADLGIPKCRELLAAKIIDDAEFKAVVHASVQYAGDGLASTVADYVRKQWLTADEARDMLRERTANE